MMEHIPYTSNVKDKIRKEYDFVVKHIKLISYEGSEYDITNIRITLNLYEDIFCFCSSGDITLIDANDLPHNMPIIGQEKLQIKFTRHIPTDNEDADEEIEEDIDVEYRVYKISERQNLKDKTQIYVLHFIEEEFIKNLKLKISQSFIDKKYSEVAEIAFAEIGSSKPFLIEETLFEHDYVAPRISPFEIIQTVACRSVSAEGNGATYFFFSDRDDYHFVSGGKLIDQEPIAEFTFQVKNIIDQNATQSHRDRTIEQDLKSVENFVFANNFDILESLALGHYASKLITYDIVRQVWEEKEMDYSAEFDTFKHLAPKKPHTDDLDALASPEAFVRFLSTNKDHDIIPWIAGKEPGIKPNRIEESVLYRYSQMKQMRQNSMKLVVSGDPRIKIGKVIEFVLPQNIGDVHPENPEELDEYIQGKYLIVSLCNRLEENSYSLQIEIVKDSFVSDIKHVDPNEKLLDII